MSTPDVVIDTNVFVSAQRSRRGASFKLVSLLGTGRFRAHVSVPLVFEYEEVLLRQRSELGLTQEDVGDIVDAVCALAVRHDVHFLWRPYLRDPEDHLVLEAGVAAGCGYIVTYNKSDFRGVEEAFGIRLADAREFLETIEELS